MPSLTIQAASPAIRTWFNAPLAVKLVASVRACYAPSMHEKLGRWRGWDCRWEYWSSLQLGWRREDGLHFNSWDNSFCVDPCQVSWCLHVAVIWLSSWTKFETFAWRLHGTLRNLSGRKKKATFLQNLCCTINLSIWEMQTEGPFCKSWIIPVGLFGEHQDCSACFVESFWRRFWCKLPIRYVIYIYRMKWNVSYHCILYTWYC